MTNFNAAVEKEKDKLDVKKSIVPASSCYTTNPFKLSTLLVIVVYNVKSIGCQLALEFLGGHVHL